MNTAVLLANLERPKGTIDMVLDTDAYNEIDDQFAIAYMLKNPQKLHVKAIYAAPFWNEHSSSPEDGMVKSYDEIIKILGLLEHNDPAMAVLKGAPSYLPDAKTPVDSPAARHLAGLAMAYSPEKPLYVAAIGAITNVASAILLDPRIAENIVIVWLGGHALHWHDCKEFNLYQDVDAAGVVFGCGAPVVQLPCMGVVSALTVSEAELRHWLLGQNKVCDYLAQNTIAEASAYAKGTPWTRVIWDVTAIAWLLDGDFFEQRLERSPIPEHDGHYAADSRRHFIQYVYHVHRDRLIADLFDTLRS